MFEYLVIASYIVFSGNFYIVSRSGWGYENYKNIFAIYLCVYLSQILLRTSFMKEYVIFCIFFLSLETLYIIAQRE